MAVVELWSHRLRSLLSVLGVLLGVASLVLLLCLVGGIDDFLNNRMSRWAGSIWIWPKNTPTDGEKIAWSRSPGLRFNDGITLEKEAEPVKQYVREIQRNGPVLFGEEKRNATLRGMTQEGYQYETENIVVRQGREITANEYIDGRPVCLLSWDLADKAMNEKARKRGGAELGKPGKRGKRGNPDKGPPNLRKGTNNPLIGKQLMFNNQSFTIIGIYEPKDPDIRIRGLQKTVIIPLPAMQKRLVGLDANPGNMQIMMKSSKSIQDEAEYTAKLMEGLHRGAQDFEYHSSEWLNEVVGMLRNASMLMGILSGMSLLVGGLGIMNVMLSSISERVQEIGLRKALGATNFQIAVQFLTETIVLSLFGGILGGALGSSILLFRDAIRMGSRGAISPTLESHHVVYVFIIIVSVGIVFGIYPAWKAARLNPIDALRYE